MIDNSKQDEKENERGKAVDANRGIDQGKLKLFPRQL